MIKSLTISLAAFVTVVVALVLVVIHLLYGVDTWLWVLVPAAVFVAVVIGTNFLVSRRLRYAIEDLRRIEGRQFGNRGPAVRGNDELTELRVVVESTGKALEKEIHGMRQMESYRRDFLGNVSHELKTPIFAIKGFAETLRDGAIDKTGIRDTFIARIIKNADRLSVLAEDLTEIAKIETGELKMHPAQFDLGDLISEVVDSVEPVARNKEMKLGSQIAPDLPRAFADERRIRQVLTNLVENGVKYTNPGGSVKISARRDGSDIVVTVADNGIGIAAENHSRITERFYRVDPSRSREQGGTGLGLAIVKHILSAHGQRLTLESAIGKGASFSFRLPTYR